VIPLSAKTNTPRPSNILCLPFRQSSSLALSAAIKQYISTKYDQHPDMFKQDLEVIDSLRRDAIQVSEPHTSGIKKIAAYAGQLAWMGSKFPIDVRSPSSLPPSSPLLRAHR
jgi:programmed cell death 6-interacting protein